MKGESNYETLSEMQYALADVLCVAEAYIKGVESENGSLSFPLEIIDARMWKLKDLNSYLRRELTKLYESEKKQLNQKEAKK